MGCSLAQSVAQVEDEYEDYGYGGSGELTLIVTSFEPEEVKEFFGGPSQIADVSAYGATFTNMEMTGFDFKGARKETDPDDDDDLVTIEIDSLTTEVTGKATYYPFSMDWTIDIEATNVDVDFSGEEMDCDIGHLDYKWKLNSGIISYFLNIFMKGDAHTENIENALCKAIYTKGNRHW